jgi:hypothetical protein
MTQPATPHALARRAQNDAIRTLYEETLVPVREIARLAGVTERNIYALVRRLGCRPRVRLASGGGRRIVPSGTAGTADSLDAAVVRDAIARCADAVDQARRLADASRAARTRSAALRQDRKAASRQARVLALLARTMRDLAAVKTGEARRTARLKRAREAKPKRVRGYEWKPMLVAPVGGWKAGA